ncbi:hydrogenase 4 subunit F [Candidatus Nitrosacidococcus tergens]|uniref:Putative [NiFe]-hydrogenase, membrane subunit HyfF n=1 Tax=Candidatus Nitrosacidococcus tergens TaxID=553981 RepID=A0A7G1QAU5_9GAMM|nr:hydrogenase 4 subunit F [Candidatus Nitrosacidococcus tergens]CAB1276276.1 putative [NiFe]-hydrogenase, membrane subunit HyfF [Candidatus Nitrosacidococcus tergens]
MPTLNFIIPLLLTPLVAAIILALVRDYHRSTQLNTFASATVLLFALLLYYHQPPITSNLLFIDNLSIVFIILNAFVGFTTSIFSASYVRYELEIERLTPNYLRFYHGMFQLMVFGMNLALTTNNIGLMWVALELATLATIMMVGIYRTHKALEAAWKYFILSSVGLALALFGTILIYFSAVSSTLSEGLDAMAWTNLQHYAATFDPLLLNIAFIFLLIGYGTKIGLVPMHAWLPDAHAEGPTPVSAVLSGLLLNVALYALLRFKMIITTNPETIPVEPFIISFGLGSLMFAAFMLYRCYDIKRMFAYSSIEHMGIIVFAFGIGGPFSNFAGLLQIVMHSLTKSAIFFSIGHITQVKGTQKITDIHGLTSSHPLLGWTFVIGVIAIAGLPPFGIFMSEFLLITSTFTHAPILAVLIAFGLLLALGALLLCLGSVAFGEPNGSQIPVRISYLPIFIHLSLVLISGLHMPSIVVSLFQNVADLLK